MIIFDRVGVQEMMLGFVQNVIGRRSCLRYYVALGPLLKKRLSSVPNQGVLL
jgi:hypothetical protein